MSFEIIILNAETQRTPRRFFLLCGEIPTKQRILSVHECGPSLKVGKADRALRESVVFRAPQASRI